MERFSLNNPSGEAYGRRRATQIKEKAGDIGRKHDKAITEDDDSVTNSRFLEEISPAKKKTDESAGIGTIPPVEGLASHLESLLSQGQAIGLLTMDGHIPSKSERILTKEIQEFLPTIEMALENGSARHIIGLYRLYDIAYRLGNKRAPARERLPHLFTRAMTLWLKGDKSVDEEDLITMLHHLDPHEVDFKYIAWGMDVKEKWRRGRGG